MYVYKRVCAISNRYIIEIWSTNWSFGCVEMIKKRMRQAFGILFNKSSVEWLTYNVYNVISGFIDIYALHCCLVRLQIRDEKQSWKPSKWVHFTNQFGESTCLTLPRRVHRLKAVWYHWMFLLLPSTEVYLFGHMRPRCEGDVIVRWKVVSNVELSAILLSH